MALNTIRHMELFDPYNFKTPVTIIGAGALGSWLALYLAKLGIEDITVYDFDVIEEHNVANQAFGIEDIGEPKVNALFKLINDTIGTHIINKDQKYTNQRLSGIVFMMVDSMAERKRIWEENIHMKSSVNLFVEARMGLSLGRIYTIDPVDLNHIKEYEQTMYSDDVSEVSACGSSMTVITSAVMIASICARQLINHNANVELDNEIIVDMMYNNYMNQRW